MFSLIASILLVFYTIIAARANNSAMLFLLPFMVIAILVTAKKHYPYILFCIAISLLLQTTLLSNYLTGSDIIMEHITTNNVIAKGFWDYKIADLYNSSSFIVLLTPLFYFITGIDTIWLFKIVSPLIYALSPVALYLLYQKVLGSKQAFIGAFLFIAIPVFFVEMPSVIREQSSQFLFIASLYVLFSKIQNKTVVFIMLSVASAFAYYTISMVILACILAIIIVKAVSNFNFLKRYLRFGDMSSRFVAISGSIVIIFCIVYYMFAAGGALWVGVSTMIQAQSEVPKEVVNQQTFLAPPIETTPVKPAEVTSAVPATTPSATNSLPTVTIQPTSIPAISGAKYDKPSYFDRMFGKYYRSPLIRTALGLDFFEVTIYGKIFRLIQYAIEGLIISGVVFLLFRRKRFNAYYFTLILGFFFILMVYVFSPIISAYMGATRFYHLTMIVFIPVIIYAGSRFFAIILKKVLLISPKYALQTFTYFIVIPYFIFNSGLVFELVKFPNTDRAELPYSIAMSNYRMDIGGIFSDKDKEAALFLKKLLNGRGIVYTDFYSTMIIADTLDFNIPNSMHLRMLLFPWQETVADDTFIFLRERNIETQILSYYVDYGLRRLVSFDEANLAKDLEGRSLLYDNGARIYSPRHEYWATVNMETIDISTVGDEYFSSYAKPIYKRIHWVCPQCGAAEQYLESRIYECSICGFIRIGESK